MTPSRNIRNIAGYIRGLWDWTFLNDCFSGKIRVADIDGIVERHGHFLWIEAKPMPWDDRFEITHGQRITHEALQRTGKFTVIVVWGTTDNDVPSEYLTRSDTTAMLCCLGTPHPRHLRIMHENGALEDRATSTEDFKQTVKTWFQWADTQPRHGRTS